MPSRTQHRCNELHVYCRLRDMRVPKRVAFCVSSLWGKLAGPILYRR
jgi:hypothetical protein